MQPGRWVSAVPDLSALLAGWLKAACPLSAHFSVELHPPVRASQNPFSKFDQAVFIPASIPSATSMSENGVGWLLPARSRNRTRGLSTSIETVN